MNLAPMRDGADPRERKSEDILNHNVRNLRSHNTHVTHPVRDDASSAQCRREIRSRSRPWPRRLLSAPPSPPRPPSCTCPESSPHRPLASCPRRSDALDPLQILVHQEHGSQMPLIVAHPMRKIDSHLLINWEVSQ